MKKYYAHADSVSTDSKDFEFFVEVYLANQADARIAELEKLLRESMEYIANIDEKLTHDDLQMIKRLQRVL